VRKIQKSNRVSALKKLELTPPNWLVLGNSK